MEQDPQKPETEIADEDQQNEAKAEPESKADHNNDVGEEESKSAEAEVNIDTLKAQIEEFQSQLNEAKESALRAQAEAQNTRRRAERDVEQAHKFSLEKIVKEMLPVVDNLERSLEVTDSVDEAFVKALKGGVEMTLGLFAGALGKFKVEVVDPEGQPFDPLLHQAMTIVENEDVEPNTVVAVMQKGYTLHGRLVRPAMVIVSKAKASSAKIDEQA